MKRISGKSAVLIIIPSIIAYIVLTIWVSPLIDHRMNKVVLEKPYSVSQEAAELYGSLDFVADLHCDALIWKRLNHEDTDRGHVDVPRMHQAEIDLMVWTVVSKTPINMNFEKNSDRTDNIFWLSIAQGRPIGSWFSLKKRVGVQRKDLARTEKNAGDKILAIESRKDLRELIERNSEGFQTAGILFGLEGAHVLEGKIDNVEYMYDQGVRMVGLTHFFDNAVGGSAHGVEKGGLTDFGRQCIRSFESKHMIVDLAHSSPALFEDVIRMARKPVVVSHTGVKGVCDRGRNLSDEQLHLIGENGGLVGIAFFEETMCGMDVSLIAEGIRYVRDLIGIEHVALGSDFDGTVTTPFDVTGLPVLVDALLAMEFTEFEIRRVMGENIRDFLMDNLPR